MISKTTLLIIGATLVIVFCFAQKAQTTKDYLNIPGPISFENKAYNLDWSSHPSADFYKQEYLPKGELTGKYKTMILVDVVITDQSIKEIVAQKIAELKQLQAGNPVVNFQTFDNAASGEYMIDFLLSANAADGKTMNIVERNVYRYKTFTDKSGKKWVMLFGVSTRAYGKDIDAFFSTLKATKSTLVNNVAKFKLPQVSLK